MGSFSDAYRSRIKDLPSANEHLAKLVGENLKDITSPLVDLFGFDFVKEHLRFDFSSLHSISGGGKITASGVILHPEQQLIEVPVHPAGKPDRCVLIRAVIWLSADGRSISKKLVNSTKVVFALREDLNLSSQPLTKPSAGDALAVDYLTRYWDSL